MLAGSAGFCSTFGGAWLCATVAPDFVAVATVPEDCAVSLCGRSNAPEDTTGELETTGACSP
jgi:hypothetical protein